MANYQKVDIDWLEDNITSLANIIRSKTGSAETLAFPEAVKIAIEGITENDTSVEDSMLIIASSAFYGVSTLTSISLPACATVGHLAFQKCIELTSIDLPVCTSLGSGAFTGCSKLTSVNLPVLTKIDSNTFVNCPSLTEVSIPACKSIYYRAFSNCSENLIKLSLPACIMISSCAFQGCKKLKIIYLMGSKVCSLKASTAFSATSITKTAGSIYVPTSLVSSYKTATNWAYFSNRIFGK